MKIVVLDGKIENPGDLSWDGLGALGELTVYEDSDQDQVVERIGDAEAVIINKVVMDGAIMDACPNLRYIGIMATGYNVIDVKAAGARGIAVTNVPGYGTGIVSQYTMAMLLEICHGIGHHSDAVHQGRWSSCGQWCFWDFDMMELTGKTMGIIGYGQIGQAVARLAQAFGMKVLAYSPSRTAGDMDGQVRLASPEEVFAEADVISLHCPMTEKTAGIINKNTISMMKDGVILLNTSRGGLVVDQDLADALNSGKIRAAGLDVISQEPISETNPLLTAKNCFITPHIAWAATEARQRIMDMVVENLAAFMEGRELHRVEEGFCPKASRVGETDEKIRLVALDLDQTTLRSDRTLSPVNRKAIVDALAAGIHVAVASGRAFDSLPQEVLEIPGVEYAITSNGAAIYRVEGKERIHSWLLEPEAVDRIMELIPQVKTLETFIEGKPYAWAPYVNDPVAHGASPSAVPYVQSTRTPVEDMRLFIKENRTCLDSLDIIVQNPEQKQQIRQCLEEAGLPIYITSSVPQLLEISHENAGKRSGVQWLCQHLELSANEAAAFGDAENDRDMLEFVGLGVAMGNASPEIKAIAKEVTLTNDEDGMGIVLQRIADAQNKSKK